ncbi:MAG: glycosyltransferase family 4 protein [Bacteroidetes bacterium]|nr:glycosyltransferase family 4 protein [Bacteroidota bacterium]
MKIAIVCGHFLPTMGYIEVHLANAFHKLGNEVKVITSDVVPSYVKKISELSENTPYEMVRLKASFSMGQMVKSNGLVAEVEKFNPDLVVCTGPSKLFPEPLYRLKNRKFKLMTTMGDNEETYTSKGLAKKVKDVILLHTLKKQVYHKAIQANDVLLPYTPSTVEVIAQFVNNKDLAVLKAKSREITLGFDESVFYYDEQERNQQREELGLSDNDNLLITATRVAPEKGLEKVIDLVDELNKKGAQFHYLIVGFQNDAYGDSLKAYIAQKECKNNIICKPFSASAQTRKYYNAADAAIFNRAAISIFEALATGLFLLLPEQQNIIHILNNENGSYFKHLSENILLESMQKMKNDRLKRVELAKTFSYNKIAEQIISFCEI